MTLARDAAVPTVVTAWSGVTAVGFLNLASTLALQPLQIVSSAGKVLLVPAVRLFCVTAVLGGTSTILVHALYGLGRAGMVFRLQLVGAALVWSLTLVLVPRLGFLGFAVASVCVSVTIVVPLLVLRRLVPIRFWAAVRVPLTAALVSALTLATFSELWIQDLPSLLIGGGIASAAYVGRVVLLGGTAWRVEFIGDWRTVLQR